MVQTVIEGMKEFEKPETSSGSLMKIVERAVFDPTFDAAKLAILLDVKLKWEADEARKAYIAAIQLFKANAPAILKTKHVEFANKSGDVTKYDHAVLHEITDIIGDALRAVGITHSWRCSDTGGRTTVTCVLTHSLGHSEDAATLSGPADTSGGKNSIQAIGSTVTYLQRYTLLAATGLAAAGTDNDGATEGMAEQAIIDWVAALKDASTLEELMKLCKQCVEQANVAQDASAKERFRKVYEERKKEIRSAR
jgi:hypothetical protein